jgi:hypothetical protein
MARARLQAWWRKARVLPLCLCAYFIHAWICCACSQSVPITLSGEGSEMTIKMTFQLREVSLFVLLEQVVQALAIAFQC